MARNDPTSEDDISVSGERITITARNDARGPPAPTNSDDSDDMNIDVMPPNASPRPRPGPQIPRRLQQRDADYDPPAHAVPNAQRQDEESDDEIEILDVRPAQRPLPPPPNEIEIIEIVNRNRQRSIEVVDECDPDGQQVCIAGENDENRDKEAVKKKIDRAMKELFPDLELNAFLKKEATKRKKCTSVKCPCCDESTIINTLSDYILSNSHEFKKVQASKPPEPKQKRKPANDAMDVTIYEPAAEIPYNALNGENLQKFYHSVAEDFMKVIQEDGQVHGQALDHCECYKWFNKNFTKLRTHVFKKLDTSFRSTDIGHNPLALAICCFLVDNELIEKEEFKAVRSACASKEDQIDWDDMQNFMTKQSILARAKKFDKYQPVYAVDLETRYQEFLNKLKNNFPEFFDQNDNLNKDLFLNPEIHEEGPTFECAVCFEQYLEKYGISCQPMNGMPNPDAPSSSKNDPPPQTHIFCRPCLRGHAKAATGEMPLAEGGVGLKCMEDKCSNPIFLFDIKDYLPRDVRDRLNERILEENLGLAQIENLERCKRCNYAIEFEASPEENKVFDCLMCKYSFCRLCGEEWNAKHFGFSCEESKSNEKAQKDLEAKLNEAIVRRCPRCKVQFVKSEACNKMTCRCGLTMCYICRATNITYDHFCNCADPGPNRERCRCKKTCFIWENYKKKDEETLRNLMNDAPSPIRFNLNK